MSGNLSARKIDTWLKHSTARLKDAGIESARLDALILLEDELGKDRGWLLAHPAANLTASQQQRLDARLLRRQKHEPLAYIRGHAEFYGRQFLLDSRVLQPRPESEDIINLLKTLPLSKDTPWKIIDVGTGSGALAACAKLEMPQAEVLATDIDPGCLSVARKNAKKHRVDIRFFLGNLLAPLPADAGTPSVVILANLPYVPNGFKLNEAAGNEPRQAIFGGPDGLNLYRALFDQLVAKKHPALFVITESLPPQHQKLQDIAQNSGYRLNSTEGFVQMFERKI